MSEPLTRAERDAMRRKCDEFEVCLGDRFPIRFSDIYRLLDALDAADDREAKAYERCAAKTDQFLVCDGFSRLFRRWAAEARGEPVKGGVG